MNKIRKYKGGSTGSNSMLLVQDISKGLEDPVLCRGAYQDKNKESIDQALKELEELLLECKPEKKTKKDVPDPYEVGIHATIPVAQASGYNQALDQWEQAILELMK